jgi:hypothetical protein
LGLDLDGRFVLLPVGLLYSASFLSFFFDMVAAVVCTAAASSSSWIAVAGGSNQALGHTARWHRRLGARVLGFANSASSPTATFWRIWMLGLEIGTGDFRTRWVVLNGIKWGRMGSKAKAKGIGEQWCAIFLIFGRARLTWD